MAECSYPNCPGGQNVKLQDERHEEIKSHFANIEAGQDRVIGIMTSVASILADVSNIKGDIGENTKQHDEIFKRLRKVENKVMWFAGGGAGIIAIVGILQGLKLIGLIGQ